MDFSEDFYSTLNDVVKAMISLEELQALTKINL
jgi:hypothetical protein